jgi:hypothetical protein
VFLSTTNVMVGFHFSFALSFSWCIVLGANILEFACPNKNTAVYLYYRCFFVETEHFFAKLFVKWSWKLKIKVVLINPPLRFLPLVWAPPPQPPVVTQRAQKRCINVVSTSITTSKQHQKQTAKERWNNGICRRCDDVRYWPLFQHREPKSKQRRNHVRTKVESTSFVDVVPTSDNDVIPTSGTYVVRRRVPASKQRRKHIWFEGWIDVRCRRCFESGTDVDLSIHIYKCTVSIMFCLFSILFSIRVTDMTITFL